MQVRAVILPLLAVALLAAPAAAQGRAWATGDTWTYDVEGGKVGSLRVTVADGGARTVEVEATHPPGTGANLSKEEVTRTWAAPMRLATETRVSSHCVAGSGLVPVVRCGNVTQRWVYTPPIEFVPPSLAANVKWSQEVGVNYTREDELDVLDERRTSEVRRYFQVVGDAALENVPAGEFRCWNIVMDAEDGDTDGSAESFCYAPTAVQFIKRSLIHGGQETTLWKLRNFTVDVPGQAPPPPAGAATATSPGAAHGSGNATLGPETRSNSTTDASSGSGASSPQATTGDPAPPAASGGPSGPGAAGPAVPPPAAPEGPGRELRTPGAEVALVVLVLAGAAWRARRR